MRVPLLAFQEPATKLCELRGLPPYVSVPHHELVFDQHGAPCFFLYWEKAAYELRAHVECNMVLQLTAPPKT